MARKHQLEVTNPVLAPAVGASRDQSKTRREVTKSADFFSIYVNDVQVQTSSWDLRLILGEMGDASIVDDTPVISIKQLGDMRMSPQLAKKLILLMAEQLKAYEEQFGEIPGAKG